MKFSVIVPVYNVEEYLVQCIESILNQTYKNYELILVDDGSKDQSGAICDQYAQSNSEKIKVIHKENQGVLAARLSGIDVAEGEFCVFIDSDDYVETTLLETIAEYVQREDLDILMYSFYCCYDGKVEPRKSLTVQHGTVWTENNKKDLYNRLIGSSELNSIWTKAIRTSILHSDETDYSQYYGKNMGEDLLHSLYPVTVAKKIMFIDKPLYNYRINTDGLSRSFTAQTIPRKNMLYVYDKIREYLPKWEMEDDDTLRLLHSRWFNDTMYMMSKYYEYAHTSEDKSTIMNYNWDSFLPEGVYAENNHLENNDYQRLYRWLKRKDYKAIKRYFKRKQYIQKYKKVKREIKACLKRGK